MTLFVVNLLLALAWTTLRGDFTLGGLTLGFLIGFAALWLARPLSGDSRYVEKTGRLVALIGAFLWDLLLSSLRVLVEVLTPGTSARPGIVAVPLEVSRDGEILLLANMITLTPGTLSLDIAEDRRTLYVHCMFLDEQGGGQAVIDGIKRDVEGRIRRVTQ